MSKGISRTKSSKIFSGHTLVTGCLFAAGLKGCPQASSHESSLVHDEKSARENNFQCLSDDMLKRHLVESSMSSAISWDEFPQSPGRYYFKLNRKLSF